MPRIPRVAKTQAQTKSTAAQAPPRTPVRRPATAAVARTRLGDPPPGWPPNPFSGDVAPEDRDPQQCLAYLASGPPDHKYAQLVTKPYRPQSADDDDHWARALPLIAMILVADLFSHFHNPKRAHAVRDSLAGHAYWLAANDGDLTVADGLGEPEIRRHLANDGMVRRSTDRSRATLAGNIRYPRGAFRHLFPTQPALVTSDDDAFIPPVEDYVYDAASRVVVAFHEPATRADIRAFLTLSRGAGADPAAMRHVTGDHVHRVPGAGLWVLLPGPDGPDGPWVDVPVLRRFSRQLEDLAEARGSSALLRKRQVPLESNAAGVLAGQLKRKLVTLGYPADVQIGAGGLRKAWICEQLASNVPLNTLRTMMRVKSLRTIETLVALHGPAMSDRPSQLAWELGGVARPTPDEWADADHSDPDQFDDTDPADTDTLDAEDQENR